MALDTDSFAESSPAVVKATQRVEQLLAGTHPWVSATIRRIIEEDRDVLRLLAAYDRAGGFPRRR